MSERIIFTTDNPIKSESKLKACSYEPVNKIYTLLYLSGEIEKYQVVAEGLEQIIEDDFYRT